MEGELATSDQPTKTGFWSGPGSINVRVEYQIINGWAITEGDICLGSAEEMEKSSDPQYLTKIAEEATQEARNTTEGPLMAGVIAGSQYRWPNCTMPYEIDPNLPNNTRVTDALRQISERTGFRFVRRTNQSDYVYFTDTGDQNCWSMIGRRGGRQIIHLSSGCSTGSTVHECLHALGFYHEQSRNDRDSWVRINWANIQENFRSNFNQYLNNGVDIGPYDYGSIMHYRRRAFAIDDTQDTIIPLRPGAEDMGQRRELSTLDAQGIYDVYPQCRPYRFSGLWRPGSGGYWWWYGANAEQFGNKMREFAEQGYRPVDIEVTLVNGQYRFSGLWRPGSGGYWWWYGANAEQFGNKMREFAEQGYRPEDIETQYLFAT